VEIMEAAFFLLDRLPASASPPRADGSPSSRGESR
jgi:hypothetical protein